MVIILSCGDATEVYKKKYSFSIAIEANEQSNSSKIWAILIDGSVIDFGEVVDEGRQMRHWT